MTAGSATYTVPADGAGFWVVDTALGSNSGQTVVGTYSTPANGAQLAVTYRATDVAGNVGELQNASIAINTSAPVIESTGSTNVLQPTLRGSAPANSDLAVNVGGATYQVRSNAQGQWFVDTSTLAASSGSFKPVANGSLLITATNSAATTTGSLVIDTLAPSQPQITSSAFTNDTTPVVRGTADAFAIVNVNLAGASYETRANAQGLWQIDTGALSNAAQTVTGSFTVAGNATRTVTVRAADLAGNISTTGSQTLTIHPLGLRQVVQHHVGRLGHRQGTQTHHQGAQQPVQGGHKRRAHALHGLLQLFDHVGKHCRRVDRAVPRIAQGTKHRP